MICQSCRNGIHRMCEAPDSCECEKRDKQHVVHLQLTQLEANAVLRALGVANVSDQQLAADVPPCTWVAKRLVTLLSERAA